MDERSDIPMALTRVQVRKKKLLSFEGRHASRTESSQTIVQASRKIVYREKGPSRDFGNIPSTVKKRTDLPLTPEL
uniref:Uncharacterized protein n=1 Tax=Vespula pensylvanica TaxID=30213 RepID=A0A834PEY1_VESPE|nr:hypothetical protein H0235_000878 [Vespula pensylvanica]